MPHTARKQSESGFYHVIVKGDGGQILFEGDEDRLRYLKELEEAASTHHVSVHAYCLMSNHVHLLMEDERHGGRVGIGACLKQLCERYAMYYARKTERVGNVFQRPYWSEPIEDDAYFLCALRYIHANPQAAGLCAAAQYRWSSYRAYVGDPSFVKISVALALVGSVSAFESFSKSGPVRATPFPGSRLRNHLSWDELMNIACELVGRDTLITIRGQSPEKRNRELCRLAEAGFTEKQIIGLTGLGKSVVHRAIAQG